MESRRPEVHLQVLGLVHVLDSFVVVGGEVPDLITVHGESNVAGCPFDLVGVPFAAD